MDHSTSVLKADPSKTSVSLIEGFPFSLFFSLIDKIVSNHFLVYIYFYKLRDNQ